MENIIYKRKENKRGAGVLLAITSLPSPYGIGTFGKAAFEFVDNLQKAGFSYWQVLPMGPTSYGDSPYQSLSAFAGNPYFIDLEALIKEGLLEQNEVETSDYGDTLQYVQYDKIYISKYALLKKAYERALGQLENDYRFQQFCDKEKEWLDDYALYMACKMYFEEKEWSLWDSDIKRRTNEAIERYTTQLQEEIFYWKYLQYKFYTQWNELKEYTHNRGIKIIGDIPLYVAYDSADVWVHPELYQLNENLCQTNVAGCPPDDFSEYGQKWGNPLYNWEVHEKENFAWWKKRILACTRLYDITRIDHFIGIVRYYCIPADKSAAFGWYEKGPGAKLITALNEIIGEAGIIAEDLGVTGPDVEALLEYSGYPGMKELEVAFNGDSKNSHLPHFHKKHGVVYIGTHDNETLKGHLSDIKENELKYMMQYTDAKKQEEVIRKVIRVLYMSVSDVVVLQMQDILEKDNSARMNYPSTMGDNWKWRLMSGEFTDSICEELRELAVIYNRIEEM